MMKASKCLPLMTAFNILFRKYLLKCIQLATEFYYLLTANDLKDLHVILFLIPKVS